MVKVGERERAREGREREKEIWSGAGGEDVGAAMFGDSIT